MIIIPERVKIYISTFERESEKMRDELTQKDIDRMKEEIEHRTLVVRKKALEDVKEARAQGDLSENFEYHAAKKFKNQNESRIRYLQNMIKTAVIISDDSKEDEAGLNNTVTIKYPDDGSEETYKLVTTVRGNSLDGRISTESPLGKALLHHKVGDKVHVKVSDDVEYDVEVTKLEKTVDDGTDEMAKY